MWNKDSWQRWYKKNRQKKIDEVRQIGFRLRLEVLELLGNKCSRCGYNEDVRILHVDHVNDDGAAERRNIGSGNVLRKYIRDKILAGSCDYQLLCPNCNAIKEADRKGIVYSGRRFESCCPLQKKKSPEPKPRAFSNIVTEL